MKIPIIIDNKMVKVDRGTPVLLAARKADIFIPTLCYHELLEPYGSCRLCIVEVVQNRQRRLVTSCNYPAEPGMEVFTDTDPVRKIRKVLVELLLARCSEVPVVQKLARRMGIETSELKKKETKECILCGLCVRFCEEVVSVSAIGLSNRGIEREVTTPFKTVSDTCIGCGSCSYICPTGCIEMVSDKTPEMREMHMGKLALEPCTNHYQCENCSTDQQFLNNLKKEVARFRETFSRYRNQES
jgi:heterodisulfide reductase subunit A